MSKNPLVSVIVLNYNAGDLLLNCVDSVFKSTYPNFEVIIVDNLSTDNSHIRCKEKFKKIQLIENEKNLGYCEGNNVGIKSAKGEFILILNPDTIVDPDWLNELFRAYQKHGEALYQPKHLSLKEKSTIMSTGNMMNVFGFGYAREKGQKDVNQHNTIEQIGYASGTCLFIPSSIFKNVGLLDPFIFLYHDDLDFGWRAAQLGIKSYYVPSSVIYHAESYLLRWNAKKFFWLERNRKYCLLTHYSKETYAKMRSSLFLVDLCVWIFYLSKGFLAAKIKAELDIYRNKDAIKIRYNQLEKIKIVSDKELIKKFPDEIFVPKNVSEPIFNQLFNNILSTLSKKVKKKII